LDVIQFNSQKLPKENNRPQGENFPNLVTLFAIHPVRLSQRKEVYFKNKTDVKMGVLFLPPESTMLFRSAK
jgi:hypothetical protein